MEIASLWINAGLFTATVLAAVIAWKGVTDARRARDEAADHASSALKAAESIASASGRTATATEGLDASGIRTAQALERIATTPPPWKLDELSVNGDWRLINSGPVAAITRSVLTEDPADAQWLRTEGWTPTELITWLPSDWKHLTNAANALLAGPASITIAVEWRWPDDPEDVQDRVWRGIIR